MSEKKQTSIRIDDVVSTVLQISGRANDIKMIAETLSQVAHYCWEMLIHRIVPEKHQEYLIKFIMWHWAPLKDHCTNLEKLIRKLEKVIKQGGVNE